MRPSDILLKIRHEIAPLTFEWAFGVQSVDPYTSEVRGVYLGESDTPDVPTPALIAFSVGPKDDGLVCVYLLEDDGRFASTKIGGAEQDWPHGMAYQLAGALRSIYQRPTLNAVLEEAKSHGLRNEAAGGSALDVARDAARFAEGYDWLSPGERFLVAQAFFEEAYGNKAWQ